MTMNRLVWTLMAYAFMAIGLMGTYLFSMLVYTSFVEKIAYPFEHINHRNGILYPVICMIVGAIAFLLYRAFLKMEREERAGLRASNRIVSTMRDTY